MSLPWPKNADFGPDGLTLAGTTATSMAEEFGTPLVVLDEEHVRERCREFRTAFERVLWAVKAFPAHALMRVAVEEGLGLLAATGEEADACLRAGAPPERIWLHGNNKSERELKLAVAAKLGMVVVDNEEEVDRLDQAAAEAGRRQPVLLRIIPGVEPQTHRYVVTGARDTKFGTPITDGLALAALKRAAACQHLQVRGIHVHVGSQLLAAEPYLQEVDAVFAFLAEAQAALGFHAELLDIGGGMGAVYTNEGVLEPEGLARLVREWVESASRTRAVAPPALVVEPGRAITANAAFTLYRVGTIKGVPGGRTYAAVDGGMSDNIRPALYRSAYRVALANREASGRQVPFTVVGRHCESGDVIADGAMLPESLARGDLLAVATTGAYEYAMSSNYNKVGRPAVVLVRAGEPRLILRREDESDLARLDVGAPARPEQTLPKGVLVRPATPADARGVVQLLGDVAAERRFIRMEEAPSLVGMRRRFKHPQTRDDLELVAVTARKEVVGNLSASREAGKVTRHVASLGMAVAKDWRGKGIGAALLSAAIRWARWAGVEKIGLSVYPGNVAAIRLYQRFGFAEEGRLTGHSRKSYGYEDEIVMGLWL